MRSRRDWNSASVGQRIAAFAVLAFMHFPVLVIILYAFTTEDRTYQFPPR
jgi:putative spermidine/putrescine transport system permease protein